jgi:NAD(P)-dependent dehydrogenase (short-subunit alcohol dehydrogenase family)
MTTNSNRIAIVTGANRGIGLQVCKDLARLGHHVVLTARDPAKAQAAAATIAGAVTPHALDVTSAESIASLLAFIANEFGRCDALVNNAAIYVDGSANVLNVGMDVVRDTVETNVFGPLLLCQAFVPMMQRQGYGRVVNVSSQAGQFKSMDAGTPAYNMSKAALNALTAMLAKAVRHTNVLINAVCPGWVRTDMGGPGADRSVEEGADAIVWLATLPDGGPTGGFFHDRRQIVW